MLKQTITSALTEVMLISLASKPGRNVMSYPHACTVININI